MQTKIQPEILATREGKEADRILRSCVHCGFCTATCPTYQLLGDERDSPRGRIYLIKQALEGRPVSRHTLQHLDRCLLCRACETTCPSGVEYGRLLEIGKERVEQQVTRALPARLLRYLLRRILPSARRLSPWISLAKTFYRVIPARLRRQLPRNDANLIWPERRHKRKMILPGGCVQSVLAPEIDATAARVLDRLEIEVIRAGGCCGAVSLHLSAREEARRMARHNIDAWWPHIEAGAEAIISSASGCGVMLKDYAYLLREDSDYAAKAQRVSEMAHDLVEVLEPEDLSCLEAPGGIRRISFHAPCTLQHGQRLPGRIEALLSRSGFTLQPVNDAHLCCGSAGTYSLTQPALARKLLRNKLATLTAEDPELIATANIGCLSHLAGESPVPVRHWIQLFEGEGKSDPPG